ncbi:CD209 antigen-like protein E [Sebastes umbrosus]|uniref:CD209 antigen-like protein E n=1 Tax=Sebastes umbrosus TaxID=72105 RepID=UPI0018A0EC26|nr:CD209 antigen-like protein E [Sebastes umbrosus]
MSEADVLYSDVKFTRERGKPNGTASSSADTTYSEVKILKKQPSTELPGSQQQQVSNGRSGVTCERVALVVLSALPVAAVIALSLTSYKKIQTMERLQQLEGELDAVRKNLTEKRCEVKSCNNTMPQKCPQPPLVQNDRCPSCEEGWEQHGAKCYHFSSKKSTWEESRSECRHLGGDLVKIESREEQEFLLGKLSEKMDEHEDKFWIGLTDSKEENKWLWVDGSPPNTRFDFFLLFLTFWSFNEPDNWDGANKIDGEDCVRMGEKDRTVLRCWFDKDCRAPHRRICDKPKTTLKCV